MKPVGGLFPALAAGNASEEAISGDLAATSSYQLGPDGRYGRKVEPPRVSALSVSGLATGDPRLAFTMTTEVNDPPLDAAGATTKRALRIHAVLPRLVHQMATTP